MIELGLTGYGYHNEDKPIGPSLWPHFDLLCIHEGEAVLRIGRRKLSLKAKQGVLIFPDTPFEGRATSTELRTSVQHFSVGSETFPYPAEFGKLANMRSGCRPFTSLSKYCEEDIDRAIRLAYHPQNLRILDQRICLLGLILSQLHSPSSTRAVVTAHSDAFAELEIWLLKNVHRSISPEEMAARIGMSTSHFRALFNKEMRISPAKFFRAKKMQVAATLLCDLTNAIKSVSLMVGYEDIAHFYRAFKQYHGISPNRYRQKKVESGLGV